MGQNYLQQSIYQVATCRPDSKTGKPKSVGKQLRDKLDDAYPGWQEISFDDLAPELPISAPRPDHDNLVSQRQAPYHVTGSPADQAPPPGTAAIQVPTLANAGSMGAGNDVLHDDVMVGTIALSADWVYKRIRPTTPGALRCMHAYGDSMSPTFEDGDILLVDTGATNPSDADGVYVLEANQRLFIKRVTERLGGGHDVTSDNPRVKTVSDLNGGHEVSVKGRVVWSWNGKKL